MDIKNLLSFRNKHKPRTKKQLKDLFLHRHDSGSRFSESYRTLQTNIQFALIEKEFQSLLVTSAGEKEGKTVTVANLAHIMAQAGKKVLMIDADLRKPMLSRVISSNDSAGLTGLLSQAFGQDIAGGSLKEFGVGDLFWLISFQKKTGTLHLVEAQEKIDVCFLGGKLIDVEWLSRPHEKRLGNFLVENQVITAQQAEQALARQRTTGHKLGYTLMNMGLLKEDELEDLIMPHMLDALRTAIHFKSGQFVFENRPESFFERPGYNLANIYKHYRQLVIGEEELPYLQKEITASVVETGTDNLFLLPSGPSPPNPAALLDSKRMSFLLSYLCRRFDRVVLDSPPILPASDAVLLAPRTDGVILVIKAADVNRQAVLKAVQHLRMAHANLIGVVLNQVDVKREGYYRYYHKYYSKYYGEQ